MKPQPSHPVPSSNLADDLDRLIADDAAAGQTLAIAALAALTAYHARPTDATLARLHSARMDWANGRAEQARRDGIAFAVFLASAWALALFAFILALAR